MMRNKSAVKRDHIERTPLNIREFEFHLISKKNSRKTCKYLMDMLGSVYSRVIVVYHGTLKRMNIFIH